MASRRRRRPPGGYIQSATARAGRRAACQRGACSMLTTRHPALPVLGPCQCGHTVVAGLTLPRTASDGYSAWSCSDCTGGFPYHVVAERAQQIRLYLKIPPRRWQSPGGHRGPALGASRAAPAAVSSTSPKYSPIAHALCVSDTSRPSLLYVC